MSHETKEYGSSLKTIIIHMHEGIKYYFLKLEIFNFCSTLPTTFKNTVLERHQKP